MLIVMMTSKKPPEMTGPNCPHQHLTSTVIIDGFHKVYSFSNDGQLAEASGLPRGVSLIIQVIGQHPPSKGWRLKLKEYSCS